MSNNAQQNFRSQLSGFRWANSVQDDSQPAAGTAAAGASTNPFNRAWTGLSGYIPLRNEGQSQEEEAYFALSRWERFLGFLACCAGGLACFFIAFLFLPILAIKPRKFALAFTLGSCLFMLGFAILHGPWNHLKHITSSERLPFSLAYFGSLALTLVFAIWLRSTIGTIVAAIVQIVALLSYLAAYFPGGTTTLRFGGQMAMRGMGSLLPI
ncbi:Got1/Sft2-like family-domain-containing protein [Kockovaella imperatae]|uniref:Protein transport protein SFT2 n=1 Tax=Kockovaella imperatae TaxID=4999 RepID=A0A1Y1UMV8_9TREE|nr:Got1/Sft2-like family-domain-containing protein [Kockovaella imperatae]ORX39349.1 Got1/Sft2-like family-domain-containing protein [Kockovaella imperatae]